LFWYDGGMKPPTPDELADNTALEPEGMMFVGQHGKILAGFHCENPRILPDGRSHDFWAGKGMAQPAVEGRARDLSFRNSGWIKAFKGGEPTYGNFLLAGPISEAFNLGAISLR